MINPFEEINWRPDRAALRRFRWTLLVAVLAIAVILWAVGRLSSAGALRVGLAGAAVFAVSWLPLAGRGIYLACYAIGGAIGLAVSNFLLLLFFFGMFTPAALIGRWRGRDVLRLKNSKLDSNWRPTVKIADLKRYFKQF